jgi:segregation and condensation protein B
MSASEIRNIVEAALLAAGKSLTLNELSQLFDEQERPDAPAIRGAIESLAADYAGRPIEVKETGAGWRVQVRRAYGATVARLWPERPQRYSRALLETLALIAYRQPITRAEIESVRGVAVNPNITKTLLERQWIRVVGHRDLPGRPELLGTTREFLEYFGLKNLEQLPPLTELRSLGELDPQLDLPVAGGLSAAASGDLIDEEPPEAEAAEADEFCAAPQSASGLVAAPPDDSR